MVDMKEITADDVKYSQAIARTFCKKWGIKYGNDIEDMISESYVALCEAARDYDSTLSSFKTYCFRVIHNHLSDVRAKELNFKKNVSLVDSTDLIPSPFPYANYED